MSWASIFGLQTAESRPCTLEVLARLAARRVRDRGNPPQDVGAGLREPYGGAVRANGDPRRARAGGVRPVKRDLAGAGVDAGDPGALGEPQVAIRPIDDARWPRCSSG